MVDQAPDAKPKKITYHYQKSNFFRVVHADGAYGGLTAQGNIHASFWNERGSIPRVTHRPVVGNSLGPEVVDDKLDGVVREIEVDVIMDVNSAIAFHHWLSDKLQKAKKQFGISDQDWKQMMEAGRNVPGNPDRN